uniref:Uncharacterized mitochondrial protein AtMg00810-like n=1 Tax=Tanacetum cinerariifolium TaxID=118510 RepID=A0A699GXF0_TANCI|nr:uncharacterized mitochondrial protein AtMg00810-like [Tanacetum cinerariifolium]
MDLRFIEFIVVAATKLPILNPNEFDLWKIRIEQYFFMTDYFLWEVILNEQRLAKKNELKAKGTLLMALPDKHQLKFKIHKDAKSLMEAIEKRFGESLDQIHDRLQKLISQLEILGETISQEDINLKFLISLPSEWKTHTLIWRNKADLEEQSLDDLFKNLKIYEAKVKGSSFSSQNTQNIAFVSSNNIDNTNESINVAPSIIAASSKVTVSTLQNVDSLSDAVIYSFFASQSNSPQLANKYLKQIDPDDLEEIDLKLQMAMLIMRARRFLKRTGRNIGANGIDTIGFDMSKVECYNCHRKGYFARECRSPRDNRNKEATRRPVPTEVSTSNALVCSSSSSRSDNEVDPCSKACSKAYATLQTHYDNLTVEFRKSQFDVLSYKTGLESVEARLVVYQKNKTVFEEDIKLLKLDVMLRDNALAELKKKFKKDKKERDDLKLTLDKFQTSSKNLKFHSHESDNSMPKTSENDSELVANMFNIESNTHKPSKDMSKTLRPDAPIVDDWISDSRDETEIESMPKQREPSFIPPSEHMKTSRESVKKVEHPKQAANLRTNNQKSRVSTGLGPQKTQTFLFDVQGNPQQALKDKGVIDSGCSRHMTRNIYFLLDFEEIDGGYVAFGGNPKGGNILGKGKIKTDKLDFDDVYFVKELKFILFSVSQMCNNKKSVLFTDTECVVLSSDFKLPDENHVLLRVARENNMYNVDLKNVVPSGDLTCLFAKATLDESNLWYIRLGHINFKATNKLVKGNLVRGNQPNDNACIKENLDAGKVGKDTVSSQQYVLLPLCTNEVNAVSAPVNVAGSNSTNSTNSFNTASPSVNAVSPNFGIAEKSTFVDPSKYLDDPDMHEFEDIVYSDDKEDMDVKSAFLYGTIEEEVYVCQPLGFEDPDYPDKVYVDGIIFGSTNKELCKAFEKLMKDKFQMNVKLASTPIETKKPLLKVPDGEDVDVHVYISMIGSLMYLTSSRLDIMYLKGKPYLGLWYHRDSPFNLVAYSDSDYAGASLDRKSTIGGCHFLGCRLISWQCKKQTVVATSSTTAEYVAAMLKFYGFKIIKKLNDAVYLRDLIDGKKVVIFKDIIRRDLYLDDADGVECLPNKEIFEALARMGYEKPSLKLTFYKAFFSTQWKLLIHTLVQCLSAKRTTWNEFSCSMASAVICLATSRKFNFSKSIFDNMVRNVNNPSKFLMYLRFLQVVMDNQVDDMTSHNTRYTSSALTQKVFANMQRVGKGFSGVKTPLFASMLVQPQPQAEEEEV